jgi:hypothetical protein
MRGFPMKLPQGRVRIWSRGCRPPPGLESGAGSRGRGGRGGDRDRHRVCDELPRVPIGHGLSPGGESVIKCHYSSECAQYQL